MPDLSRMSDHELRRLAGSSPGGAANDARAMSDRDLRRIAGVSAGSAFQRGLADSVSLSFGDELMGLGAGVEAVFGGRDFRSAYDRQVERSRANLREAREDRPLETGAGELAGFLVPGIGAARVATRGANLTGRLARAGGTGAAFGGVSGAGAGENLDERLEGATIGGGLGAVFGAGAQGVFGEALPNVLRSGRRLAGLPRDGGRMGVAERAREDLMHAARQNERLNVQDFGDLNRVVQEAAARDPNLTVAEALGRSAINRVVKYSRLPGRTAERAEQVLQRNADTFDELTQRLDDTLTPRRADGSPLTMRDANGELDAAFSRASIDGYQQALSQPISAHSARRLQAVIRRHPEFYEDAIREATAIARGEGIRSFSGIVDPRLWHYVKVAAGDRLRQQMRSPDGLGRTRARQVAQSVRRLTDELDRIPGYAAARREWGSLSEAREALEAGFGFDRMRPDDVQSLAARLTPFQQRYLQAGVAERIRDTLTRRDNQGIINISRDLTNRRKGELMRAAFGDKRGAVDDFLDYANLRRQMHNDARRMASSQESPTGIVTGEAFSEAIPTGSISLRATAARAALNATVGRLGERNRDILGRVLLTPVGEFGSARRGLLARADREARRRESRRTLRRTQGAYLAGVGGMGVYDPREDD